jgi:hypothetical protein
MIKLNYTNYQIISLICTVYKIFTNFLANRLQPHTEEILAKYQARFRPRKATTDQMLTVKGVNEKFWEHDLNLYEILINFRQTYDNISRGKQNEALVVFQIPSKLTGLIKATIENTIAQTKINYVLTQSFQVKNEVRRWAGPSPI